LDGEIRSVLLVGGRLLAVIERMGPAWEGPAALGVNPEIGRSSIRDHGELLGWCSDFNIDEVLGVQVVLDSNVLSTEELLLNSVGLVQVHILGHFSLVDWNSSGRGGTKEGGDGK
jgi:hypothetical protein